MKERFKKWLTSRLGMFFVMGLVAAVVGWGLSNLLVGVFSTMASIVIGNITVLVAALGLVAAAVPVVISVVKGIVNLFRYIFSKNYRNNVKSQKLTKEQKKERKQARKQEKANKKEAKKTKKQEKEATKLENKGNKKSKKAAKAEKKKLVKEQNDEIKAIKNTIKNEKQADQLEALNNKLLEAKKNLKEIKKNDSKEIVKLEETVVAEQLPPVEVKEKVVNTVKKEKPQLNEENLQIYKKVQKEIRSKNFNDIENISSQDAVVWLSTLDSWKKELKGKAKDEYTAEDARHLAMIKSQKLIKTLKTKAETSQASAKNDLSEISVRLLNNTAETEKVKTKKSK